MITKFDNCKFREALPANCPPDDAGPLNTQVLVRLVEGPDVTEADFDSQEKLGYECTIENGDCEWASCSMFLPSVPKHKLVTLTKYKRLKKKKHVAYVEINELSGIAKVGTSKHVDVWMFQDYTPSANIGRVVGLDAYEPS
ncbi:MAG: hypothetical protein KJ947_22450 [Alphaproteobacteria bacterium]|jgi:hypothetical protein|nr:hypothetical protein [Alphaproteobacteria bacterium]MBU1552309.1 hypothetical protein [Alphaproteobacteria bacterium]MBU2334502.1 hypothetical protein [Alphaproteobacteria bacterium]MBU2386358.1 hypothetical protein [Alphaproteobacteria bacterium]|tara:strand:- start:1107 stop:1529 length:423 start_codon:yes stop_codon:yes gene_type:complete